MKDYIFKKDGKNHVTVEAKGISEAYRMLSEAGRTEEELKELEVTCLQDERVTELEKRIEALESKVMQPID